MNQHLYDAANKTVTGALLFTEDTTTKAQLRHTAHEAVTDIFNAACAELREHPDLDLEQALFMFGQRL